MIAFITYTYPVKWMVEQVNPKDHYFEDQGHTQLASFHLEVFSKAYTLNPPQQFLNKQFLEDSTTQYNFEEIIKSWMDKPTQFLPKPDKLYPISQFREDFSLLESMLCRLYRLPK